jgi:hypothetical protein
VIRGTKKLRDRVKGGAPPLDGEPSTTALGDWFANALFWRPQVALLVNTRTLLPVFMELAPAATLLDRAPAAIEAALVHQRVDDEFLLAEIRAMSEVRIAPTNDRRVVGVMNEFAFLGERIWKEDEIGDLELLSLRLSSLIVGGLDAGSPDRALANVARTEPAMGKVIPIRRARIGADLTEPQQSSAPPTRSAARPAFQLKVTLLGIKPAIWRRVVIDGSSMLDEVHVAIQAAFGWWNYHLHEFEIDGVRYGVPDADDDWGDPPVDERRVRLEAVAEEGSTFRYEYDFGDGWEHRVVVEKVSRAVETPLPACIDGRRACPPEDCGGTGGYEELLEILADPRHPEHEERREWIGRPFDPEAFDPADFDDSLRLVLGLTFEP